ncbi:hypothetical protein MAPG_01122 [Magnaporthiopsis poae ATCC 64411]|uniref:Uncharacterized protein n=1 Tax=Magnaporthiopsis poae (strain ATCC 64411 / 73-15) TaxID=644358 RepID=A0A0C4DMV7_MAGP6|nr:hypothetical protein MAPG_01122 [Magnaporthiopsis poae ATCC 64411]
MERDARRDRGQWKGCHSFKNGGLKMGQTYYYYYELDGSTEVHDPSLPSTTACPSLPGQPVNTIHVPYEMSTRKRSASLSSVRDCDFMTVKPEHKFLPTRATPPAPEPPLCRQATSHVRSLVHKRSTRSLSPNPSWSWSPRRLFSRSKSSHNQKEVARNDVEPDSQPVEVLMEEQDERPIFRSPSAQSCRSRDISPDSLLRFLSDDAPLPAPEFAIEEDLDGPAQITAEDIAEENDDDDNFATSAQSETAPITVLSPPPSQRSFSSSSSLARLGKQSRPQTPAHPIRSVSTLPTLDASRPQSRLSTNSLTAPHSPESTLSQAPSFYFSDDDDDDDDDEEVETESVGFGLKPLQAINTSFGPSFGSLLANFSCYTLPEAAMSENKMTPTTVAPGHAAHREAVAPAISIARVEDSRDLAHELR